MTKVEIIDRLQTLAQHAVHMVGETPFAMSLDDGIALREAAEWLKVMPPTIVIPCGQCMHWTQFSMEKADNYGLCCHEHTPCCGKSTESHWFCGSGEKEKDTTNSSEVKSEFT